MNLKVDLTEEAVAKIKEKKIEALRLRVREEVYEWTTCCMGDVCAIVPLIEVTEERGEDSDFKLKAESLEIYLNPELLERVGDVLTIDFEGKFIVKGARLSSSYILKPPYVSFE